MKELTIQGKTLQYEIMDNTSEYGYNSWTEFYLGTTTRTYQRFGFFGKVMTEVKPKYVFTIHRNIESKNYTKKTIRKLIETELELLDRAAEIARGEII
jgi:hypothetical protein